MERNLLGGITVIILSLAAVLWFAGSAWGLDAVIPAAMLRIGIMLAVIWTAIPNIQWILARVPSWLLGISLLLMAMMAIRPRSIILLGPILLLLWVLAPQWFGKIKK
jgi:hypothetical protein